MDCVLLNLHNGLKPGHELLAHQVSCARIVSEFKSFYSKKMYHNHHELNGSVCVEHSPMSNTWSLLYIINPNEQQVESHC